MASAPLISVSPEARSAAIEKAIAMRWSEPESMRSAVQLLVPGDVHAVFMLGDFGPHGAKVADNERDPVRLLDAQLAGVADAHAIAGYTERSRRGPGSRR